MQTQAFITLKNISKEYRGLGGTVVALKGINLDVRKGEFLVITGKSGAGKTTLVNVLTGLDRATGGEIWVDGTPVHCFSPDKAARWRGRTVGVVFQTFELLPTLSLMQNVMLPMDFAHQYTHPQRRERAMHLLQQVGIAEHARKPPTAISGGQQQRVAIARALANDPALIVADEPTGSLDSTTASAVLDVFATLAAAGKTIILVTHDKDVAARGSRVITLADGAIIMNHDSLLEVLC